MKGNLKRSSSDLLSPVRAHNKDIGTATQTLLIEVKLRLQGRLVKLLIVTVNMCDSYHYNQSELFIYDQGCALRKIVGIQN